MQQKYNKQKKYQQNRNSEMKINEHTAEFFKKFSLKEKDIIRILILSNCIFILFFIGMRFISYVESQELPTITEDETYSDSNNASSTTTLGLNPNSRRGGINTCSLVRYIAGTLCARKAPTPGSITQLWRDRSFVICLIKFSTKQI